MVLLDSPRRAPTVRSITRGRSRLPAASPRAVPGIYDPCFTKKAAKNNWEGVETHLCHPCRD